MAETIRQGLRDLLDSLDEQEQVVDEMLAEALALRRERARQQGQSAGPQGFAFWITGDTSPLFLDFNRPGNLVSGPPSNFGGGRASGGGGGGVGFD